MAKLKLSIGDISVSTERETAVITFSSEKTEERDYTICMVDFSFKKKMYQPTEVLADLQISMATGLTSDWKALDRKTIEQTFKHKKVSLEVVSHDFYDGNDERSDQAIDIVGNDYYVQEVRACYMATSIIVKLKIYSLDKLLTLSKYSRSWTAKRLSEHILGSELPNFRLPYNHDEHIVCDASKMKHLLKNHQEHIFPYLVQYNESFYDLLIRTCNRWGEFVFWEDGKLNIGYDADKAKAKDISGYRSITFHDYTPTKPISDTYVPEAPYDNNVLNSTVKKDSAAKVFATIKNMADLEAGADYYWLAKVGQVLTNNKSILNFMFDTAVNDLITWAQQEALVSQYNDKLNDDYFKKKKEHVSMLDEQYKDDKKTLNLFSEAKPIVGAKEYAAILTGEMIAEQNIIDIDYDTTWPGLKLGNLIKVNNEEYIVVEISSHIHEDLEYKYNASTETVNKISTKSLVFQVTAIAKEGDTFYPTMIPSGHIRTSGPQVAVVVDVDDPIMRNRVRVKYPWQLTSVNPAYEEIVASNLKDHDVSDATPWLIYASANGPAGAGVHGRHYLAEKVLVNYANNNVERPYVVGAVSTATPKAVKIGSAVLQAPNGEYIKVHEGTGKGATAFMANFTPGLSLANGFVDMPDLFGDSEMSKCFEGGVDLGDRYGIWKISGSTDKRAINISSPWGTVSVNAFTGISINAPNGNISIKGKNVSIEAGNNLTLTSGANIRNKYISSYGDGAAFNILSFMYDVGEMAAKKMASMVESVIDLSLIRSLIEVYWRPQEGELSVQSNRYLKLSAGGAKPGYPDAAYRNPKKKAQETIEKSGVLEMGPAIVEILGKVPLIVDKMLVRYQENYAACVSKKGEFDDAIKNLVNYSNSAKYASICKQYDDLKNKFWDPKTTEIAEADLGFTEACKADSINDINELALSLAQIDMVFLKKKRKSITAAKEYIIKRRKACKEDIVKKANALLKSIIKLRTESQKLGDDRTYTISRWRRNVPLDYIGTFKKATSPDKCKDSAFFKYAFSEGVINDSRANLTSDALNNFAFHRKALIRMIALNLVEGLGMKSQAQKPANDDALENSATWEGYVNSLEFTMPMKTTGSLLDALGQAFSIDNLKLATPFKEYATWGNAKAGQILFGTGTTLYMNSNGGISPIDASDNQGKLSKALLKEQDEGAYDSLNSQIQKALKGLDSNVIVNNNQVQQHVANNEDEEDSNSDSSFSSDDSSIENQVNE